MTFAQAPLYFRPQRALGFGGPVVLVARVERDLVEERRWFTLEEFRGGVTRPQLALGPLVAQLAMHLGWLPGGARGDLFRAPSIRSRAVVVVILARC